jgi:hypothetical protein
LPTVPGVWSRPSFVAACYTAIAIVMTWPLVTVMTQRIAGDLGDPLFNAWILNWTGNSVLAALSGHPSALARYWNPPIFYPASLTLAYSEHLTPQMLQILPILAATGNIVLCYNLLLLSTIVLSGLGMFLLVRELTGRPLAAFFAGLAFAFAPYRIDQWTHIEVLSSQWMPFAFYGLRSFFASGRLRPLLGAGTAILLQGLSCGYYLAYFPPFVVAYCVYEMWSRGRLANFGVWRALMGIGGAVLIVIGVFLRPYFDVRHGQDLGVRDAAEVEQYSADLLGFATVSWKSRLLGPVVHAMPRNENQGFPGVTMLAFAAVAVGAAFTRSSSSRSLVGFFACAALAAAWMSLGPVMHVHGAAIGPGLYDIFYRLVPGFDGLRVPSLNFMIVTLFLCVLAGVGAAAVESRARAGSVIVAIGMIAALGEGWSVPVETNRPLDTPGYSPPTETIGDAQSMSLVYQMVRRLPADAVIAEFPFDDPVYQIQYTYYSAYHGRPILNGYSGFFPDSYRRLEGILGRTPSTADAWSALLSSGATFAIVHERAYPPGEEHRVSDWLRQSGARQYYTFGGDVLFQLR